MKTVSIHSHYLELRQPPTVHLRPPAGLVVRRLQPCPQHHYREVYSEVGTPWGWIDRLLLSPQELQAILDHPRVEVFQLTLAQRAVGFAELDGRLWPELELAHLGIVPDFLGRGFGPYLLNHVLHHAWAQHPRRLWVHTCDWDHPSALRTYQQAGFAVYQERTFQQSVH